MLIYDEKHKEYIYNWRKNNPEKFKEYINKKNKEYYQRNKEKILENLRIKRANLKTQSSTASSDLITLNPL
jgi:hypothetical protein